MSVVDALTALPYIGDDPLQLTALLEGIDQAGAHLATYVADLGSARSSTKAAWQAIEAGSADTKTATLQDSGDRILTSLKSASQAVSVYTEEVLQTRKSVDGLRDEWELARSQNTQLESRVLLTPEDETTANADAARLTDEFSDIQRRFFALVTTMDTAAGYCAQALNSAADPSTDPKSLYTLASYELDPGDYFGDKTLRHNTVRDSAVAAIRLQIIAEKRPGDPRTVGVETAIPGGSNTPGSTKDGKADITWDDGTNIWIWEVKGPETDSQERFIAQSQAASSEAAGYVTDLQEFLPKDIEDKNYRLVQLGFPLVAPPSPTYKNYLGQTEDLPVSNSDYGAGGLVYMTRPRPPDPSTDPSTPPSTPPPTPPPSDPPSDLSNIFLMPMIGREDPLERLQDIASAAGNLGSATSDAVGGFNQSMNDLSWRLMNDAFNPWSGEAPIEGLWDGAGDVWTSATNGAGQVWNAAGDLVDELNPFDDN